jgi:predicted PurR-regulated permease PerM
MDPGIIGVFIPIVAIIAVAAVKIARIAASRSTSVPAEVTERLEALERDFDGLQQQLTETQERLDFTERLLSQAREERRLGG